MDIRRGDVLIADLSPALGSEQRGTRPCLVVQNDLGNDHATTTIIVPFTTAKEESYPFEVLVPESAGPLREHSVALCNQIRTISVDQRVTENIGSVDEERLTAVERALEYSLALRPV